MKKIKFSILLLVGLLVINACQPIQKLDENISPSSQIGQSKLVSYQEIGTFSLNDLKKMESKLIEQNFDVGSLSTASIEKRARVSNVSVLDFFIKAVKVSFQTPHPNG